MRNNYLPFFIALAVIPAMLLVFTGWKSGKEDFEEERTGIIIRKIGHELLLLSGDRTSRVLPVKQLRQGEYLIQFESPFSFVPDSLLTTIQRIVHTFKLPPDYMVNVMDCTRKEVVFGYAMSASGQNDISTCIGRNQPKGCYSIKISFTAPVAPALQNKWMIFALLLPAAAAGWFGWNLLYKRKKRLLTQEPSALPTTGIAIGQYAFYKEQQCLLMDGVKTELTAKESGLLDIFANSPNQVIDRARLQKEIWEDEGVIVGRSLDVFVSKLRKKLDKDAAIRIVNIHGKGYKLEISDLNV